MDIPLKSQPKVSTVNLVDESKFLFEDSGRLGNRGREIPKHGFKEPNDNGDNRTGNNYRLTRTYSDSEKSNFDEETGHRLYDDGKIRPQLSRSGSEANSFNSNRHRQQTVIGITKENTPKIYSRSHNEYIDGIDEYSAGLEDEYIPGLDFGDLIYQWNRNTSDQNLRTRGKERLPLTASTTSTASNTPSSRDQSYLDLKTLHAKVAPQPIRLNEQSARNSFTKLHDFMKLRTPKLQEDKDVNTSTATLTSPEAQTDQTTDHKHKKQKPEVDYEWIMSNLPPHFEDLPYSQRKKLVASLSDSVDYSQFSVFAKNYLTDKMSGSSGRTPRSGGIGSDNGSFIRRSRRGSINTVAGRLLAMSSSVDLKKMQVEPKTNVDEKGAFVMEHELGKVIGFGAWGTIRECTDRHGTIRAMKIVKSCRDFDTRTPSPTRSSSSPTRSHLNNVKHNNPKVLEVFKKEIAIWKQLQHENILPLLKHLETETAIFCITNRIWGGTLFELVSSWGLFNGGIMNTSGPLEFSIESQSDRLKRVKKYARQIVKALAYMHEEKGIVHGDLKLENVLVENQEDECKMILCDFGMSRVYTSRVKERQERNDKESPSATIRSKSSTSDVRRPYYGESTSSWHLNLGFNDDSKIGISNVIKSHGPSLQSLHLTPVQSETTSAIEDFKRTTRRSSSQTKIDSELPHSHIGSLPYASPELLSPSPPPLGPSADIWALGVLLYTMCVGKLPFQHQYEPRLRAIITAAKYDKSELRKACLMEWIYSEEEEGNHSINGKDHTLMTQPSSLVDLTRQKEMAKLHRSWKKYVQDAKDRGINDQPEYEFERLYDIIVGCLELNITNRWDLGMIADSLE